MIREFIYQNNLNERRRRVFVTRNHGTFFEGIDLSLLPESDVKFIEETYKDVDAPADGTSLKLDKFDLGWLRAFRRFSLDKIKPEE